MILVEGIPADKSQRTEEQSARWLLAALLDWHRREDKADWWEYFRLRDLPDEELLMKDTRLPGCSSLNVWGLMENFPWIGTDSRNKRPAFVAGDTYARERKIGEVVGIDLEGVGSI